MIRLLERSPLTRRAVAIKTLKERRASIADDPVLNSETIERLGTTYMALELLIGQKQTVPSKAPTEPAELKSAVTAMHAALALATESLGTSQEAAAIEAAQDRYRSYMSAVANSLIDAASKLKRELPTKDPEHLDWATSGVSGLVFGSRPQWTIYQSALRSLRNDLRRLGDLGKLRKAELGRRLEFLAERGDFVSELLRTGQAITLIHSAMYLKGVLTGKVWESYQLRATHAFTLRGLKADVIDKLAAVLAKREAPSTELIGAAYGDFSAYYEDSKDHIKKIEEFEKRMELFVDVASTLVGARAMTGTLKALTKVSWLYRGGKWALRGKGLLRFAVGSAAFTGGSMGTRSMLALLGGEDIPGAGDWAKAAAMDFATLGLLKGAHHLTGAATKNLTSPALKAGLQHTAAFTTLWAWSTGWEMYQNPDAKLLDTLVRTGKHTAVHYAAIAVGFKLASMPQLQSKKSLAAGSRAVAEWDRLAIRAKKVGKNLKKKALEGGRVARVEGMAKEAQDIVVRQRQILDLLRLEGRIVPEEAAALYKATIEQGLVIRNLRDAARLGLTVTGKELMEYRSRPENLEHYLGRLKRQGVVKSFEKVGDKGAYQVTYEDGSIRYFQPSGKGQKSLDLAVEALRASAPKVDPSLRGLSIQNLSKIANMHEVTALLKAGSGGWFVLWTARPDVTSAIGARVSPFRKQLLSRMIKDESFAREIVREDAVHLQRWFEAPFETVVGQRSLSNYLGFLRDLRNYRGSLEVRTLAEARAAVAELAGTSRATPAFDPSVVANQPAFVSPGYRRATPFEGIEGYLAKEGYSSRDIHRVKIGGVHWAVRVVDGTPVRAWRFTRVGHAPDLIVNVAEKIAQLQKALASSQTESGRAASSAKQRANTLAHDLAFLRRIRGIPLSGELGLLNRAIGNVSSGGRVQRKAIPIRPLTARETRLDPALVESNVAAVLEGLGLGTSKAARGALTRAFTLAYRYLAPFVANTAYRMMPDLKSDAASGARVVFVGRDGTSLGLAIEAMDPAFFAKHGAHIQLSRAAVETAIQDVEASTSRSFAAVEAFRGARGKADPAHIPGAKQRLDRYLASKGIPLDRGKVTLVDTSFKGTVQELLAALYPGVQFQGRYMFLGRTKADPHPGSKKGYVVDVQGGIPDAKLSKDVGRTFANKDAIGIIEELLHGHLTSPKGIGPDGPIQGRQSHAPADLKGLNPAKVSEVYASPKVREGVKSVMHLAVKLYAQQMAAAKKAGYDPGPAMAAANQQLRTAARSWIEGQFKSDPALRELLDSFVRRGDKALVDRLGAAMDLTKPALTAGKRRWIWKNFDRKGSISRKEAYVQWYEKTFVSKK